MKKIYILNITTDIGGEEVFHCDSMEEAKKIVFECFPDWDINTDTINDIDARLREGCEGSITINTIHLSNK